MYYYQHNIGDFDKATRHLTRIERSIYRDLIELYYDTEMQLNADIKHLCRKILANSNEEVTAVEQVLNEFFTLTPNGWYHDRCEEEIERFKSFNSQRSLAGKKSAAARQEKRQRALNGCSTSEQREANDAATNQKPETRNQEPLKDLVDSVESPVDKKPSKRFLKPDYQQVHDYMIEINKGSSEEAQKFVDFYESKGWLVGKSPMKDWKAAVRNWTKNKVGGFANGNQINTNLNRGERLQQWAADATADFKRQIAELERQESAGACIDGDGINVPDFSDLDERLY